jgi:hypothetical protein
MHLTSATRLASLPIYAVARPVTATTPEGEDPFEEGLDGPQPSTFERRAC